MATGYIALVCPAHMPESDINATVARLEAQAGLAMIAAFGRVRILSDRRLPYFMSDRADGILIGYCFQNSGSGSRPVLAAETLADLNILESWWGGYLAVGECPWSGSVRIVRDSSGIIPCYHTERAGMHILASEPRLLVQTGFIDGHIDRNALLRFMISDQMRASGTCLRHLDELLSGMEMKIAGDGSLSIAIFWSPWRSWSRQSLILDEAEAVDALRSVVMDCVQAWAQRFDRIILNLSGGLDSSIVAAALPAGTPATCLTLVTSGPSGDERVYAREVSQKLNLPLVERLLEKEQVDLGRSAGARFPRPTVRAFAQAGDAHGLALAEAEGADAFFNGGGGDNVFCYLQSGAPAADQMLVEGIGWKTIRTIADMSRLASASMWSVAQSGLKKRWARHAGYHWPVDLSFLIDDAKEEVDEARRHPWLDVPAGALPGTASHIALLLRIQNHLDSERGFHMPVISPLLSQPIVELCLQVPSWLWFRGGRNRSIARQAFADRLPPSLVTRLAKGTPDSFVASLFVQHRSMIAEMLSEGTLAEQGLLDVKRIKASIDGHGLDTDFWRLMRLVDIEAWARSWRFSSY